jgi:hypothetical protein
MLQVALQIGIPPLQGRAEADDILFPRPPVFEVEAEIVVGVEFEPGEMAPELRGQGPVAGDPLEFPDPRRRELLHRQLHFAGAEGAEGDALPVFGQSQQRLQLTRVPARADAPLFRFRPPPRQPKTAAYPYPKTAAPASRNMGLLGSFDEGLDSGRRKAFFFRGSSSA